MDEWCGGGEAEDTTDPRLHAARTIIVPVMMAPRVPTVERVQRIANNATSYNICTIEFLGKT